MTHLSSQKALVLGATGQQGGAVAKQLLAKGWHVRVLVRDSNKPAARLLHNLGAELVAGDLEHPTTITTAMQGMHAVFSVQGIHADPEQEVRQGLLVATAARETGIAHLVYSSAFGAQKQTGLPGFEAKRQIEQAIRTLDLPATILRPVMFMENFRLFAQRSNEAITLPALAEPDISIQMIAVHDIAYFATLALQDPTTYIGQTLNIAGDEQTLPQIADLFQNIYHRPVRYQTEPADQHLEGARKINALLFGKEGERVNLAQLRHNHPQLLSLEAWLQQAHLPL
uniref:NmrA family transcriptional regulator n=1 Tax=Thermosporothrix sp. COM3 TaxID=2490863 RepID=A0A455SJC8_9CHLR|nr:NmrA family transcriptional regulator [Thermosporothrix sp. COM3]